MLPKDDFCISPNRDFSKDATKCNCTEYPVNIKEFQMNKGELVDAVAEKASVTKKQADAVLTAALETIIEAVSSGDKVTLVGFGSFESRERKAREGRNPKTNEKMEIPATRVPAFSAGKLFREKVAPPKA
ncbi:HU family DNA-binding protein [Trichormus variabilis ARAD]|nr:HU family DNA-binding protein [Trichormus variabilis ARAD]MBC1258262.1 HU family DNA-binding protein [Trichormus variabilis V5]MBC1268236.1 HU family DNA-binding protein [Trichormus variabilis FSR]MBC1302069.1 HU family DNA-binding protein [Trichormus variabilis N2B]MBC1310384.1 HU family DNA-binding protein [Trichormus variabilis PNB]MBC1327735.1 HU family DNA-binding protein [Trichormus variabilis 9RC]MBD2380170.1 HU family DNA-binding protein [Trichormus variabilis FACHB-319]QHD83223.1